MVWSAIGGRDGRGRSYLTDRRLDNPGNQKNKNKKKCLSMAPLPSGSIGQESALLRYMLSSFFGSDWPLWASNQMPDGQSSLDRLFVEKIWRMEK